MSWSFNQCSGNARISCCRWQYLPTFKITVNTAEEKNQQQGPRVRKVAGMWGSERREGRQSQAHQVWEAHLSPRSWSKGPFLSLEQLIANSITTINVFNYSILGEQFLWSRCLGKHETELPRFPSCRMSELSIHSQALRTSRRETQHPRKQRRLLCANTPNTHSTLAKVVTMNSEFCSSREMGTSTKGAKAYSEKAVSSKKTKKERHVLFSKS